MDSTIGLQGMRVRFCSLGCKLNFAETASFAERLLAMGFKEALRGEKADICIVNTCAVTEVAAAKCRQAINRLARENEGAFIVVTGCYAQLEADTIGQMKGVSLVLGTHEKAHLIDYLINALNDKASADAPTEEHTTKTKDISSFAPSCSRGNRTRYFLKVQDGCNYYCTYCTIPLARGHSRNPSIASLVAQAQEAAQRGAREIVITGVNIGDFGRSTHERFLDLVKALDKMEGIDRYRLSSVEPDLLDDELIMFCAEESKKFMPHFHIPLQSGSNAMLTLMHRRYDAQLFAQKVERIKALLPHAFIGVDIMVGCRGESEELFSESYRFVASLPVSKLHVFPYSERRNTAALAITPIVDNKEKRRRADLLLALSAEKEKAFCSSFIGKERPVLFERAIRGGVIHGLTDNYIRVELAAEPSRETLDNEIRLVRLTGFNSAGNALECALVEGAALSVEAI